MEVEMNKKEFAEKVANHEVFSNQERGWLRSMADKYPFSSVLTTLSVLADHAYGFDTADERRAAALTMCDSYALAQMLDMAVPAIETTGTAPSAAHATAVRVAPAPVATSAPLPKKQTTPIATEPDIITTTPAKPAPKKQAPQRTATAKPIHRVPVSPTPIVEPDPQPAEEDNSFDILSEINTFQEVSFKTAPKSVILSNFLQSGPREVTEKPATTLRHEQNDDKKSLRNDTLIGTETLAVILEKQGRFDRALAIYKNLLALNPEKSSTFAPRIKKLESIIKSKK